MALQLVLDANGNYTYQDVAPQKTTPVMGNEFEAYEKKQETKLAGDTNIGAQTEQLIRETPGQYTTTFNEQTGQFETKTKGAETAPITVDTSTLTRTADEDPNRLTALQQVERLTAATRPTPVDVGGIARDAIQMFKPTLKEKVVDTALQAGSDIAVSYITNKLLSKTFAGSLAAQTPFMTNPYTAAATLAFDTGIGKKAVKGVKSAAKKIVKAPKKIIKAATGKVVCTMMNDSYGFGSFRNAIWLRYAKQNLSKQHEIGYHKIFLPLVKFAKQKGFINKIVKNILEHIAIHRTIDIRKEEKNKIHLLGRVYRKILEPICYWVGR
tara:strand:- start:398 stop:1372 length:975 start_codon:yes stop_codon:yes gene_type:complete